MCFFLLLAPRLMRMEVFSLVGSRWILEVPLLTPSALSQAQEDQQVHQEAPAQDQELQKAVASSRPRSPVSMPASRSASRTVVTALTAAKSTRRPPQGPPDPPSPPPSRSQAPASPQVDEGAQGSPPQAQPAQEPQCQDCRR